MSSFKLQSPVMVLGLVSLISVVTLLTTRVSAQGMLTRKETEIKSFSKAWWARRISKNVYTAGRLTDRQVRYVVDAGFKSLLMAFNFTDTPKFGGELQPSAAKVRFMVLNVGGLRFQTVFSVGDPFNTLPQLAKFRAKFISLPRPILVTCKTSHTATFLVLSTLAQMTMEGNPNPPEGFPEIDINQFFYRASVLGLNYNNPKFLPLIANVTGQPLPEQPIAPANISGPRKGPWWIYPVYRNFYVAGQIGTSHPSMIGKAGFRTIINTRRGVKTNGKPSQEETPLINIKDKTGTYKDGGRQTVSRLEATRIDPSRLNAFISDNSSINYEMQNKMAFGDQIGYNEFLEKKAVSKITKMKYIHIPMSTDIISVEWFSEHKDLVLNASKKGPVLVHCGTAYRATFMSVLCAAVRYGKDLRWAEQKLDDLGYTLGSKGREIYADVLPTSGEQSLLNNPGLGSTTTSSILLLGFIIIRILAF